jgi:hypothetical protein
MWIIIVNRDDLSTIYAQNVYKCRMNIYSIYKCRYPKIKRKYKKNFSLVSCEKTHCEIGDRNRMNCVFTYYNVIININVDNFVDRYHRSIGS